MALAVIYLVLLVWIIVMKLSTFSDLYEIAHIRSVNFIPFFYNCENDVHLLEVIINIVVFIPPPFVIVSFCKTYTVSCNRIQISRFTRDTTDVFKYFKYIRWRYS